VGGRFVVVMGGDGVRLLFQRGQALVMLAFAGLVG
jgi:hypothetical protein